MPGEELQAQQKLQWLGLSSAAESLSDVQEEVELLQQNLPDFSTFLDHLQNGYDYNGDGTKESLDSYPSFDDYLAEGSDSIGFTTDEADSFIEKIKQNFSDEDSSGTSFDEFKEFVINETVSFESIKTGFGTSTELTSDTTTSSGQAAAGVRFHETAGVTRNGVSVPAGTTEVYGKEVHFSQSSAPTEEEETGSIDFKNISTSDDFPFIDETVTISVDIENTQNESADVVATFLEDGTRIDARTLRVGANSTRFISFEISYGTMQFHEYSIKNSDTVSVQWQSQIL